MRGAKAALFGVALLIAGCGSSDPAARPEIDVLPQSIALAKERPIEQIAGQTYFPQHAASRALASCPETETFAQPQPIGLKAVPVILGTEEAVDQALAPNVTYAGGWHLTSDEPNFGGLSGLGILQDGTLLSVSDAGAFVHIEMGETAPTGTATINYMRGPDGRLLDGKRSSDAEGLHVGFGLAAVSFERDHRIAVFNLDACGAAARGVPVSNGRIIAGDGWTMPSGLPDDLPENGGLEALTFDDGNFLTGVEAGGLTSTPLFRPNLDSGQFLPAGSLKTPSGMKLTGLDTIAGDTYAVFRRYVPIFGNTIEVRRGDSETLLRLKRPLTVDNFEGITATLLEDGTTRLFIISDDNFSERQRTLLMAFDIAPTR